MRFLIDEALQDSIADRLGEAGHDTAHVRGLGLAGHTDDDILALAVRENRIVVTTDTDFGTILALTGASGPSVLLLRGIGDSADERLTAIVAVLPRVESDLLEGAVVVLEEDRYRIRRLPVDEGR